MTKYFSPTLRFLHLLKSKYCSKINNSLPLSAIRENLKSTHTAENHISLSCFFFSSFFDTATYQPVNTFVWLCSVSLPLCYTSMASFKEKTKKKDESSSHSQVQRWSQAHLNEFLRPVFSLFTLINELHSVGLCWIKAFNMLCAAVGLQPRDGD